MTRDLDLVRQLIFYFNDKPEYGPVEVPPIPSWDDNTIKYHCLLLYQAGMLDCEPIKSSTSDRVIKVIPFNLTWKGHEFAALSKSETAWGQAKSGIVSAVGAVGGVSMEIMVQYLKSQLKTVLGIPQEA